MANPMNQQYRSKHQPADKDNPHMECAPQTLIQKVLASGVTGMLIMQMYPIVFCEPCLSRGKRGEIDRPDPACPNCEGNGGWSSMVS